MKTFFYKLREVYRSIRSVFTLLLIKLGMYKRISLPSFEWDYLYHKWDYKDPKIYIRDTSALNEVNYDLSIIVPLYNSEKHLLHLIKMFQEQTTKYQFELILVNDGSKDKTRDILAEVEGKVPFVRVINQKNGGISKARNTGINCSHGKYISFMDHDDEISRNYIQKLMSTANTKKAEIVKCWYGQKYGDEIAKTGSSSGFIWGGVIDRTLFNHIRFPEGYWYEDMINNFVVKPQAKKAIEIKDTLYFKVSSTSNASKRLWTSTNYKALEHIYLIRSLIECYHRLELTDKEYLFTRVLKECSSLAVNRTKKLDTKTRMHAFQACCALLQEVQSEEYLENLSTKDKIFYKALMQKDFALWNIAAKL